MYRSGPAVSHHSCACGSLPGAHLQFSISLQRSRDNCEAIAPCLATLGPEQMLSRTPREVSLPETCCAQGRVQGVLEMAHVPTTLCAVRCDRSNPLQAVCAERQFYRMRRMRILSPSRSQDAGNSTSKRRCQGFGFSMMHSKLSWRGVPTCMQAPMPRNGSHLSTASTRSFEHGRLLHLSTHREEAPVR